MTERDPRLYIDCTSTYRSGLNTGVQRVVRALIAEADTFAEITQLECIPICYQYNAFYTLEDAGKITAETQSDFEAIDFRFRDVYLCPDAFWTMGMVSWFAYLKDRGVSIATVIYDLIPVIHPQFFDAAAVTEFETSLFEAVRKSDLLFTISKSTKQDLINYCLSKDEPLDHDRCQVIPLAPALQSRGQDTDPRRLPTEPFFLMVGTVEPRRGYLEALAEYRAYQQAGGKSSLLIIGKEGGSAEAIIERMLNAGSQVTWLNDADDAELIAAYQQALAVICPSRSEGYGMSVSEGLMYNGLVLANRLPVFGEFAGSLPYYFDIDSQGDLARLLTAATHLPKLAQTPDMGTWRETAQSLASGLVNLSSVHGKHRAIEVMRNSAEAVRWVYWLYFQQMCTSSERENWLKFGTVQEMVDAVRYHNRSADAPLNTDSVRWLQQAINGRQGVDDIEAAYWCTQCDSVADMRRVLLMEHYRLDAPTSELFVRWALMVFQGNAEPEAAEISDLIKPGETNGDLLAKLRFSHDNHAK